jgi:hypothetical protein
VLFVCAKPLHAGNGVVLVDIQAAMPHAFTPALPSDNKRIAPMVLLIDKEMDSHLRLAPPRGEAQELHHSIYGKVTYS